MPHIHGHGLSILRDRITVMELGIPISRFNPNNVKWGQPRACPFRKTIPFGYQENNVSFNNLILILHPLRVSEIDYERNQLVLEETNRLPLLNKIDQFQQAVSLELEKNSKKWLDENKLPPVIKSPLQPWFKSKRLTLYLSSDPRSLHFFVDGKPAVFSDTAVKPGDIIRAVVKLQGLSLQMSEDDIWTGKSRIQHNILKLYKVSA